MKSHEELLEDDLQSLGLTRNEGKVLISMVKLGIPLEAPKISSISGVPRSKTYQVLEGLIEKSIIEKGEVQGKANIYRLLFNSTEIITHLQNRLLKPIEKAATRSIRSMKEISNSMRYEEEGIQEVSLIQGQNSIERAIKRRIDSAKKSILTNITPEFVEPIEKSLENAKERGVDIDVIMLEEEAETLSKTMNIKKIFSVAIGINLDKLKMMIDFMPKEISPIAQNYLKKTVKNFGNFLENRPILFLIDQGTENPSSFLIIKSKLGEAHNTAVQTENKDFIESISAILNVILNIATSIKEIQNQFF